MAADAATRRAQYNSYIKQGLSEMEATLLRFLVVMACGGGLLSLDSQIVAPLVSSLLA